MLRLERVDDADGGATIRLHGRVGGEWVAELRSVCERALDAGTRPLRLDLANVTYIDQDGLTLFRKLWPHIVVLRSSLFAAELLKPIADDYNDESRTSCADTRTRC